MAGYVVALVKFTNRTKEFEEYVIRAEEMTKEYGGVYMIRGPAKKVSEGDYLEGRSMVVSRFPTFEDAEKFFYSDVYQAEVKPLRDNTGIYDVALFESF